MRSEDTARWPPQRQTFAFRPEDSFFLDSLMPTETTVQAFVHGLEEGGWATWVRRILLGAFVVFMITWWMLWSENGFKGISHETAMEQAQISREIARGNGYVISRDLSPKLVPVASLMPLGRETRKHPPGQVRKLAASLQRFGFEQNLPLVDDGHPGAELAHVVDDVCGEEDDAVLS